MTWDKAGQSPASPDLTQRIGAELPNMSKKQRMVGEFILQDLRRALFWSASRIARELGVSLSTVIRFATDLGFAGFPELQAALQAARPPITSMIDRLEEAREQLDPEKKPEEIHHAVWRQHMTNLEDTLHGLNEEALNQSAALIVGARQVYVFGAGSAAGIAIYFAYNLNLIRSGVHCVADNVAGHLEKLVSAGPEDVLVCLAFPRYSFPTVEMAQLAASRGVKVIAVTDGFTSPVVPCAATVLPVTVRSAGFHFLYAGVLCTLDSVLAIVGMRNHDQTRSNLAAWEQIAKQFAVYATETKKV